MTVRSPYADRLATIPIVRRTVELSRGTTAYWEYGDADASTETLLVVHGYRGDHHGLEPVIAFLEGVRVISPDLPGFGETPPLDGVAHDIEAYADWLAEFAAAVAPGAPVLGHSFGSIVAAAVAGGLDTPRVILVNPIGAPALEGPRGILTRLAVFYYWAGAKLPRPLGDALLRNRLIVRVMSVSMAKTRDPRLRAFIHDQHDAYFSLFGDRDVLHEGFVASVSNDVRRFAPGIAQPTLLIAAEKDDITPIEAERHLQTLFPRAELVEIPDVGHLIHYETPQQAAAAIRRFLRPSAGDTR